MDQANNILYNQNLIIIKEEARAKIFFYHDVKEYDCSKADIFRNGLLSIVAEKNSQVEFIKVQNLSHYGINFETVKISAMEKNFILSATTTSHCALLHRKQLLFHPKGHKIQNTLRFQL